MGSFNLAWITIEKLKISIKNKLMILKKLSLSYKTYE